ncbi:MAG: CotH kinase family protein [Clostridia bacterium]|nr:CotH kinase family protein [Clostridia bacterium]
MKANNIYEFEFIGGKLKYYIDENGDAVIIDYVGENEILCIPMDLGWLSEKYDTSIPVANYIPDESFQSCTKVKTVIFGIDMKLGLFLFTNCDNLSTVVSIDSSIDYDEFSFTKKNYAPQNIKTFELITTSYGDDYIVSALSEGRELATQGGVPVVMFIDGELYSVTYLREKQNSDYFYDKYGIAEEDLVVVSENVLDEGTEAGYLDYKELIKLLNEKDASDPLVYEEICKRMDVQSFIDFMTVNLYCNNIDISLGKNMRLWRSRTGGGEGYLDGRWRFALYDTDAVAWAYYVRTDTDFLETDPFRWTLDSDKYPKGDQKYIIIPFFENLLKNESFREQFVLTYLDIANETFGINGSGKRILDSIGEGDNAFVLSLLEKRAPYAIGFLKYALDITGENCSVCIKADNPKAGRIKVNTVIADTEDGEWNGEYISGYSVTLTAIPEEGYMFAGWEGDVSSTEESLTVDLTEAGLTLEAVFEKEGGN